MTKVGHGITVIRTLNIDDAIMELEIGSYEFHLASFQQLSRH